MALHNEPRKLLLDDGLFQVCLDPNSDQADDMAAVYLERQGVDGACTRIGSVHLQACQEWVASIAAEGPAAFRIVSRAVDRRDAIVALWQRRHDAFLRHFAL